MFQKLRKIIGAIESYPLSIPGFLLAFSAIISLRMLGENWLAGFEGRSLDFFVGSTLAAYLFFLFSIILMVLFLSTYLRESIEKIANLLLWGFFLVVFPPIFDKILCKADDKCWSFYVFDGIKGLFMRFFAFFGDSPTIGITYGVRIEVALAILFVIIYAYIKQKNAIKAFGAGLGTYAILFVLGTFPSWLAFLFLGFQKSVFAIQNFDIAAFFLSPANFFSIHNTNFVNALNVKMNLIYAFLIVFALVVFFFLNFRDKLIAVAKNVRWIQISVHVGLILFGAGLGAFYFPGNFTFGVFSFFALANLILSAVFGWLASVFLNDVVDLEIDKISNEKRPTVTGDVSAGQYKELFWASFTLSMLLALTIGVKFFLLIAAYQVVGWVYSCFPFRLKRIPLVATLLSAFALTLLFSSGFMLLADNQSLSQFPVRVFWLLIIAFTVSLPIKDLKDIEGDRKNDIWTIPVLLGKTRARFFIGLGIFISYSLSVVWLNARILFLPAMVLGAASLAILQSKKISPRRVHVWVFGFLFLYVVLMAYFLFWSAIKLGHN